MPTELTMIMTASLTVSTLSVRVEPVVLTSFSATLLSVKTRRQKILLSVLEFNGDQSKGPQTLMLPLQSAI